MNTTQHAAPLTFMQRRRQQHRDEKAARAAESAKRQAGSMTRAERDALTPTPTRLVAHSWVPGTRQPYTDPVKAQAKAMRAETKAARRPQNRGR